jgi:predicted DNA-binding ribbon-helix-helix protein
MSKKSKSGDDNRIPIRSIRVSDEDWADVKEMAKSDSLPVSTWIKQLFKREKRRRQRVKQ